MRGVRTGRQPMIEGRLGASFRDPSGFVYVEAGRLYRQVNRNYESHYDLLMSSGLYDSMVADGLLVRHVEVPFERAEREDVARVLLPDPIPYVSYPYEWCFSQLKDAALLTLDLQSRSLSRGMTLKDASAFNVQFVGCRPVFIDTLSFEQYADGAPWVAYRQFCAHFLAPLALMSRVDARMGNLLRTYLDGIPLDLASRLLPSATRLRPGLALHIHAHARSQRQHGDDARRRPRVASRALPKGRLVALIDSLRRTVAGLQPREEETEWAGYYQTTSYSSDAMSAKERTVRQMVDAFADPADMIHDVGANTGRFSRLLAEGGRYVVSHDMDPVAVERNYLYNKSHHIDGVLPLLLDVANPSPSIGWALEERTSTIARVSRGTVVALAIVHHLAITNNVPLPHLAELFATIANTLIVEFVSKTDPQVQRLLMTRPDIFPGYSLDGFERACSVHFEIRAVEDLPGVPRTLFAMHRRR